MKRDQTGRTGAGEGGAIRVFLYLIAVTLFLALIYYLTAVIGLRPLPPLFR